RILGGGAAWSAALRGHMRLRQRGSSAKEMRVMRTRIGWLVLAAALWLRPGAVSAQYYEVPQVPFTGPLSHPRYEGGGIYVAFDALAWQLDRRIRHQAVAFRGFVDTDGTATNLVPPVKV